MYQIKKTKQFQKSYNRAIKRGLDVSLLKDVIEQLQKNIPLAAKFRDHQLTGNKSLFRECHIQNDWLLVYLKQENTLTLTLVDTGTHSDLFG